MDVEALQRHKGRLLLIRAQLDVEIAELDASLSEMEDACPHRDRTEITTMGATVRTFHCRDCGQIFEEPIEPGTGG